MSGQPPPDDSGCTIIHVDMDAFYASVAIRDRPELRDVPVIVGGARRGVVLAATYAARAYGIRSGMPGTRARRLCPGVVVVRPDHGEISDVSAAVMDVFASVTPRVRAVSMDEAFLDVSGALRRHGSATRIGEEIRARIADEQRITCSVGVAATTQLAKLASRRAKPDGLLVVPRDHQLAFLHPLAVDELWGVGDKTARQLRRLGLQTVGELARAPVDVLVDTFGPVLGRHLQGLAWGGDDGPFAARSPTAAPERSMGHDETFGHDVDDPAVIERELLRLAAKLTARMRAARLCGRTVVLKVRFHDFTTITRSRTLAEATNLTPEVHGAAVGLYHALGPPRARIRLVGVRVQGLVDVATAPRQLVLGQRELGWAEAESAIDEVTAKFGRGAVRPGSITRASRP